MYNPLFSVTQHVIIYTRPSQPVSLSSSSYRLNKHKILNGEVQNLKEHHLMTRHPTKSWSKIILIIHLQTSWVKSHKPKIWSLAPNIAEPNCLVFKSLPSRAEPNLSSHWVGLGFSVSSTHSEVISMSSSWIGSASEDFGFIDLANLRL